MYSGDGKNPVSTGWANTTGVMGADHPFIYLIRDRFGNICFMGQYCGN